MAEIDIKIMKQAEKGAKMPSAKLTKKPGTMKVKKTTKKK